MMNTWIQSTKNGLLKAETENINSRLDQWQIIVNECTKNEYISAFKSETNDLINLPSYNPSITDNEMNKFLLLILNWNGINSRKSNPSKLPRTLKEYQLKAKNQINGSRARHYSRTLYPSMIDCAETYANNISQMLFINISPNNYETDSNYCAISQQCATLFYDILMYSYLVQLCQCRLRVTKQGRRVYLLCDNSIIGHKSNTTTKMFQKYASDHPYIERFPSHREEAIDYFNKQKSKSYSKLFLLYQKRKTFEIMKNKQTNGENVIKHGNNVLNVMSFIKQFSVTKDKKRVHIYKDTFNCMLQLIKQLEKQANQNMEAISDLKNYISSMENDNNKLQQSYGYNQFSCDDNGFNDTCNAFNNNNTVSNAFECEKQPYKPTEFYGNECDFNACDLPTIPTETTNFGSFDNASYVGQQCDEFNNNNQPIHNMFHEFECDSVIMNSTPICAPMSVDNQLLYAQNTNNNKDQYISNQFDYDNISQYNII